MAKDLTYSEFSEKLKYFIKERDWEKFHTPKNLAMKLSIEAAEMMEHFCWLTDEQSKGINSGVRDELKDEIGDVFILLLQLAQNLGIVPLMAVDQKLDKNAVKYPADRCKGSCLKYTHNIQ